jgi:hypothetical protein
MAAVLAPGPGSALSHRSASAHLGFRPTSRALIEVTVSSRRHPRRGIQIHHSSLPSDEVMVHRGIPVTTPPRTLLDLAAVVNKRELERAINQAEVLRLFDALSLEDLIHRYPNRHGTRNLRAILADAVIGTAITREELEHLFISFLDRYTLQRPDAVNYYLEVGGRTYEVDCLWRRQRLIVELDGRGTHGTRMAFEADRERDRVLQAAGWRVIRITWRQLHDSADLIASDLQSLLFDTRGRLP